MTAQSNKPVSAARLRYGGLGYASRPHPAATPTRGRARVHLCYRAGRVTFSGLAMFMLLLMAGPWGLAGAGEPYGFNPPEFLEGPVVSRAASGNTYSFRGIGAHPFAALQLTRVELPPNFSQKDVEFCAQAFLGEIEKHSREFFWQRSKHQLRTGSHLLDSWRWTGVLERGPSTGVVSCGAINGGFIAITFEDQLRRAADSFPAIRSRLSTLEFK